MYGFTRVSEIHDIDMNFGVFVVQIMNDALNCRCIGGGCFGFSLIVKEEASRLISEFLGICLSNCSL